VEKEGPAEKGLSVLTEFELLLHRECGGLQGGGKKEKWDPRQGRIHHIERWNYDVSHQEDVKEKGKNRLDTTT